MIPAFADSAATRRWKVYFAEVDRLLAAAGSDAAGMRGELEMHVVDSLANQHPGLGELERLEAALVRLGRPIDYLRPLVADELIERGTRTYHPTLIARGLLHGVLAGSARAALAVTFGIGYLLLGIFSTIAVLKPLWGDHVGLFWRANGMAGFGIVADTAGTHELLGLWSIPIALLAAGVLYIALTRALRAAQARR